MKRKFKLLFWISFSLLVLSNVFWVYQAIDNAIGHTYYKESCDEYYQDMLQFKRIIEAKPTQKEAIEFLAKNEIEYDSFQKGDEFVITFRSFGLIYNENGELISSE